MAIILGEYTISIEKNFNYFSLVKNLSGRVMTVGT